MNSFAFRGQFEKLWAWFFIEISFFLFWCQFVKLRAQLFKQLSFLYYSSTFTRVHLHNYKAVSSTTPTARSTTASSCNRSRPGRHPRGGAGVATRNGDRTVRPDSPRIPRADLCGHSPVFPDSPQPHPPTASSPDPSPTKHIHHHHQPQQPQCKQSAPCCSISCLS